MEWTASSKRDDCDANSDHSGNEAETSTPLVMDPPQHSARSASGNELPKSKLQKGFSLEASSLQIETNPTTKPSPSVPVLGNPLTPLQTNAITAGPPFNFPSIEDSTTRDAKAKSMSKKEKRRPDDTVSLLTRDTDDFPLNKVVSGGNFSGDTKTSRDTSKSTSQSRSEMISQWDIEMNEMSKQATQNSSQLNLSTLSNEEVVGTPRSPTSPNSPFAGSERTSCCLAVDQLKLKNFPKRDVQWCCAPGGRCFCRCCRCCHDSESGVDVSQAVSLANSPPPVSPVLSTPPILTPSAPSGNKSSSILSTSYAKSQRLLEKYPLCATFDSGSLHAILSPFEGVASEIASTLVGLTPVEDGVVMLNQFPVGSKPYQQAVGFVSSHSVAIGDATVERNLEFAVKIRMDTSYVPSRIRAALALVGLEEVRHKRVDRLTALGKRLVQVAMELIADPCVLVIESPDVGLSVYEFVEYVQKMKRIAQEGNRAVIIAAAQFPWALFEALDGHLMLCGQDAKVVYSGRAIECSRYFTEEAGVGAEVVSSGQSLLDQVLAWETEKTIFRFYVLFQHSHENELVLKRLKVLQHKVLSSSFRKLPCVPPPAPHWCAKFLTMASSTLQRSLLRSDFAFAWIGMFLSFSLCALLSHRQHNDQDGMQNKRGIAFFILSCAIHINGVFIENEWKDYIIFRNLRQRHYFSIIPYMLVTLFRLAFPRIIFSFAAAVFAHFLFRSAIPLAIMLGLTSLTHSVVILLFVTLLQSAHKVMFAHLIYYGYCVVFCGFIITPPSVPKFVSQMSLLRPGYGAAVAEELRGLPYSCDAVSDANVTSYCYTGDAYLQLQGFQNDTLASDAVQLTVTCIVFLVLLGASLAIRH